LQFEILGRLGEGSYGAVFKARDRIDDMIVAIKVMAIDQDELEELQAEIDFLRDCDSVYIVAFKGQFKHHDHQVGVVTLAAAVNLACLFFSLCCKTLTLFPFLSYLPVDRHGVL
jgi:serine/threonine protein kinase